MKVNDIVKGVTALQKLNNMDLPISLALKVNNNSDKCQKVLELFEEKRKAIIDSLELEEGESLPKESIEAIENHLEEDIDLSIALISLEALEAAEVKLSASDLTNLNWMFEFDVEDL
jgi:hypothetical protein